MKMTINVDKIRVASPCHARWNDMDGDERARFCRQCSKHVFNLSAMTRGQIETLVREKEGKFCGRFHRRADGTMLTADCPSRLRRVRERLARIGGALCALVLSVAGCGTRETNSNRGEEKGKVVMGDIAVPPVICATNPSPEIMGIIALPEPPQPPNTNAPVLMGEIFAPSPSNSSAPPSPVTPGK
ncbi:MAG: hypothetical protein AAB370_06530 [Verrucomicrobiota bacterium]